MKFNKVIREYVEKELTAKRLEANKADVMTASYLADRDEAIAEIKIYLREVNREITKILQAHNMDYTTARVYGEPRPIAEAILRLYETEVCNQNMRSAIRDRESKRYEFQKAEMERIELECALGADKEAFMKMLSEISFE